MRRLEFTARRSRLDEGLEGRLLRHKAAASCAARRRASMDTPPDVEATNAAARAMLRDHLRDYVERNGDDASYEAWIATVHPENVRLDDRLRLPQSEHRAMWDARPRVTTASRQASGGGLVALIVGAVFAFAVYAAAIAFIAARAPLFFGARALSRLRGALRAYSCLLYTSPSPRDS